MCKGKIGIFILVLALGASLVLAACSPAVPAATPTPQPVTVKIGTQGYVSDAGIFIALEKGYFKEQGIQADYATMKTTGDGLTLMARGDLEVSGGSMDPTLFNAILRGINLKMVADKSINTKGTRFFGIMVRKDLADTIKKPADLKGKKVGTLGLESHYTINIVLKSGGLRLEDVNLVDIPNPADHIAAFANKSIDAAIAMEPFVTIQSAQGVAVPLTFVRDVSDADIEGGTIVYSEAFARNTDVARRFMVAYIKGVRDYNDAIVKGKNKAEIVSILAKYSSLKDPAMYEKVGMPGLDPDGKINTASVEDIQQFYVSRGVMANKLDLSKVIDMQFADYAAQKLGPYK